MKKVLIFFVLMIIIAAVAILIFIPKTLIVNKVIYIESSDRIIYDYLITNKNKDKWWPKDSSVTSKATDSSLFVFKKTNYRFFESKFNSTEVTANNEGTVFKGNVYGLFEGKNSVKLVWSLSLENNFNPLTRMINYIKATVIKKEITTILEQFGDFAIKEQNIYGLKINRTIVKDTLLLTTNKNLSNYPSMIEIYSTINNLTEFAKSNSSQITNSPMLNIIKTYEGKFNITIALPVNKSIVAKDGYFVNKMFPGNILETEVKGGRNSIDNGFVQLKNYMKDFKLTSPAMPFEMMITDRSLEPDTTKWITKLYYPIF